MNQAIALVNDILEAIAYLQDRKELTEKLRGSDLLIGLKEKILKFLETKDYLDLNHVLQIYRGSNNLIEGERAYETTIWNSDVNVKGKTTILEYLLNDLEEEYEKLHQEEVKKF